MIKVLAIYRTSTLRIPNSKSFERTQFWHLNSNTNILGSITNQNYVTAPPATAGKLNLKRRIHLEFEGFSLHQFNWWSFGELWMPVRAQNRPSESVHQLTVVFREQIPRKKKWISHVGNIEITCRCAVVRWFLSSRVHVSSLQIYFLCLLVHLA